MLKLLLTGLCAVGFSACQLPDSAADLPATPGYPDLQELVTRQVQLLEQRQPSLEKTVQLRGGKTDRELVPQADWEEELQIFAEANINRPAYRGAYTVTETKNGAVSRKTLEKRPDSDATVLRMVVEVDSAAKVKRVKVWKEQNNYLFKTNKRLQLQTSWKDGEERLISYQAEGMQQLIFSEELPYNMKAVVSY